MSFYPISPLVQIPKTSYAAQSGVLNEKWAVRVVRGRKILAEKEMMDLTIDHIIGIIYGHIRLEGLSRHTISQVAGRLMRFSRDYQKSGGICQNYEPTGLYYDDE